MFLYIIDNSQRGDSCLFMFYFFLYYLRWISSGAPLTWLRASLPLMPLGDETDLRQSRTLGTRPSTWGCSPGSNTTRYDRSFMNNMEFLWISGTQAPGLKNNWVYWRSLTLKMCILLCHSFQRATTQILTCCLMCVSINRNLDVTVRDETKVFVAGCNKYTQSW